MSQPSYIDNVHGFLASNPTVVSLNAGNSFHTAKVKMNTTRNSESPHHINDVDRATDIEEFIRARIAIAKTVLSRYREAYGANKADRKTLKSSHWTVFQLVAIIFGDKELLELMTEDLEWRRIQETMEGSECLLATCTYNMPHLPPVT